MDNTKTVSVIDPFKHLAEQWDGLFATHCAVCFNDLVQRNSVYEFKHHKEKIALPKEAEERGNVGIIQFSQRYGVRPESLDNLRLAGEFRLEHFDRDLALKHQVDPLVNGPHAPLTDLLDDLVIPYYCPNHKTTSASRVSRTAQGAESPPPIFTIPTVIWS